MALPILGAIAGTLLRGAGSLLARGGVALTRGSGGDAGRSAGRVAKSALNRAGKRLRKRKSASGSGGNQQQPTSTAPGGSAAAGSAGATASNSNSGQRDPTAIPLSPGIPNMMQDFADNLRQSSKGLLEFAASTGKASVAMQGIDRAKAAFGTLREAQLGQAAAPIAAREIAAEQRIQAVTPTDKAMAKAMAELYASWAEFKAFFMPFLRTVMQVILLPMLHLITEILEVTKSILVHLGILSEEEEEDPKTPIEHFLENVAQNQRDKDKKLGRK